MGKKIKNKKGEKGKIGLDEFDFENIRPYLVGRKFSVFCIQTFRKQGKRV